MENTAPRRAKSNQAHPEETAQLVGVLDPCDLQMLPHPFMKAQPAGRGSVPPK